MIKTRLEQDYNRRAIAPPLVNSDFGASTPRFETMIGSTLSHYEITDELGRGGMGIVYRAQDTKLNREVALKVLPSAALATEEDRARFYREAQAAAQLHHSNIATIFEIDEAVPSDAPHGTQPSPFIAMEYIEGETLEFRIKNGPLKLSEVVQIASEVAEALKLAHSKEIVHRDVKSANVMLTKEGSAKVLDFGLAKTTQSTQLTRMGSTLGTVAYMSPEQARGEEVDNRTDLWALGVVIYEMIAGVNPFGGDYEQAVVYSILNSDPEPLTAIRTGVPMELERIIGKLLAKSASSRFQTANDLLVDLRNLNLMSSRISSSSQSLLSGTYPVTATPITKRTIPSWTWAIAGLVVGLAFMQFFLGESDQPRQEAVYSQINLPPGVRLAPGLEAPLGIDRSAIAVSPDGKTLAIVGFFQETSSIYVRRLSENLFQRLVGTEAAYAVAFSPSGEQIAFFVHDRLLVIPVSGGSLREVASVALPYGLLWLDENTLLFDGDEGLSFKMAKVAEKRVTTLDIAAVVDSQMLMGETYHPTSLLPNGTVLVDSWTLKASYRVDLKENRAEKIAVQQSSPRYVSSGYVVSQDGMGVAISAAEEESGLLKGNSVPLIDSLYSRYSAQFAVSSNGIFVAARGLNMGRTQFKWLNEDGSITPLPLPEDNYGKFEISPDGLSLAVVVSGVDGSDILVFDVERGSFTRLTNQGRNDTPIWSGDGKSVIYQYRFSNRSFLLKQEIDGLSLPDTLARRLLFSEFASPDGQYVATAIKGAENSFDLFYFDVDDPSTLIPIAANSGATEGLSKLSRSGDFVAYTSSQTGNYQVYVQPFPPDGSVWNVSIGGGEEPVWADDDRLIYYRYGDNLYSATVTQEAEGLSFGIPQLVYAAPFENVDGHSIDVSPIDSRVLLLKGKKDPEPVTTLELITNVTSLVDKR